METKNLFKDSINELKEAIETSKKEEVQNFETFITQHMFSTMLNILNSPVVNNLALKISEKLGETNSKELFEYISIIIGKVSCSSIMIMKDIFTQSILTINQGMVNNLNNTSIKDINRKLTDHDGALKIITKRLDDLENKNEKFGGE